ncbi:MAG: hypothetical protein HOO88_06090 [Kiritimatiellaceae bacterium]|nr:hypothetical protein [Kiritimatiellaceae bacterium]
MKMNHSFLRAAWLTGWMIVGLSASAVQLIADRHFQDGVIILAPVGGADEGLIQHKQPYGETWWRLAQWGSTQSIYGVSPAALASGSIQWSNSFKTVALGPQDSVDGDLILAVDSVNEYGGVYRKSGESWPAFLISQRISNPQGWFKNYAPSIADLNELIIDIEARLLYAQNIYTNGYSSGLHAAHFLIYFTVQNLQTNPKTADYGNYYWFGLALYDDRYPLPGLAVAQDGDGVTAGTGKLMYNIGIAPFCTTGLRTGEWKRVTGDILPHIKAGLQEAWALGYLTNSFNYADYKIGGMNMGWEVPGLSRVAMQVRNFGLQAYGLNFARPYEFNTSGEADGWGYTNLTDQGAPGATNGTWVLTAATNDPQLIGPPMRLNASLYQRILIRTANAGNPVAASIAQLYWKRSGDAEFSDDRSVSLAVAAGGGWKEYLFDVSGNTNWSGEIIQLRFDPVLYGDGHSVGVDYIRPVTDSVSATNAPSLTLALGGAPDTIFWKSRPYEMYTMQTSTTLVNAVWTDVPGFSSMQPDDSVMQYSIAQTNRSGSGFFRVLVMPGS